MKIYFRLSCSFLCLLAAVALVPIARSADVIRSASVFEEADQGSKQVLILRKGQTAKVTGETVEREDRSWLPVTAKGKSGWVESDALTLTADDVGYTAPQEEAAPDAAPAITRTRYWFGAGPVALMTSEYSFTPTTYAGKTHTGLALSAGMEALLGQEGRWMLGARMLFPWVREVSPGAQGFAAGRVRRTSILPSLGYAPIAYKLEFAAHAGLTYINGESPNFDDKIGFTPGITLGWQFSSAEPGATYHGLELGAFRIEETRGTSSDVMGLASMTCAAFGTALGSTSNASCTRGIAPAAYVFTLMYKVGSQK